MYSLYIATAHNLESHDDINEKSLYKNIVVIEIQQLNLFIWELLQTVGRVGEKENEGAT